MRIKSLTLCSASMAALLLATPAFAQDQQQPASPPDPTVEAQEQPADPEAGSAQTDDAVQTATGADQAVTDDQAIVVTGLRRSIQSAQNIKRNSEQIVDAIVAEDIGKLPDVTASAAVARIQGVQVNRAAAEAAQVQIRGLPDISTTYNSREIFTAIDRFVAIQDFPAGSVGALEVFKAGTANLIEGGLGGQVNVRSRRPFDFNGFELSGSFNVVRFTQADDTDWNGNILFSNRWDIGDGGEIGLLLNAAMTNIDFLDSTREQARVMRDGPGGVRIPDAAALFLGSGDRYRPSANFAVEYRPSSDLRFHLDGLYQGYRGRDSNLFLFVPLFAGDLVFTDFETNEDGLGQSYTASGGGSPDGFQEFRKARTDTYQIGGGVSYDMGALRLSGDVAYTNSRYRELQENVDFQLRGSPDRNIIIEDDEVGGPAFEFINYDTTDPNNWLYRGLFERKENNVGKGWQMRGDAEWETGFDTLPRVQFGLRRSTRDSYREEGGRYRGQPDPRPLLSSLPLNTRPLECGFDYNNIQGVRCLFGVTYDSLYSNLREVREFIGQDPDDPEYNPTDSFRADERSTAGYAQIRYEFDAGFPIDGNIGVRVVRTRNQIEGTQRVESPGGAFEFVPVSINDTYTDVLPNLNMRFEFTRDLQARLAYTETRTRPNFRDQSPSVTLFPRTGACDTEGPTSPNCFRGGRGGNPNLKPINSRNYDATLEYFLGRQTSVSLALFRRDVRDYIFRGTQDVPGGDDVNFLRLDSVFNSGKGKIRGVEVAGTVFADTLGVGGWLGGFGLQANYTYIDATTELAEIFSAQLPGQQDFPGVSEHSYNLVGIYERGPLSARLAYNWRSDFVVEYQDIQGFQAPLKQDSLGQLDFSMSYTPIENLTIAFDALNLLAGSDPIRTYRVFNDAGDTYPFQVKYLERVFSLGVRVRY